MRISEVFITEFIAFHRIGFLFMQSNLCYFFILFLKVKTNYRTAVTIPEKSWSRFRDIFSDYVDKMKDGGGGGGVGTLASTPPSSSAPDSSPGASSGPHKSYP